MEKEFMDKLAGLPGGETLLHCFQCGICTSSCPVAEEIDLKPHQVSKMAALGFEDLLMSSKLLWDCTLCYMCTERCPKQVSVAGIITALRNVAIGEGMIPPAYKLQVELIFKLGRIYEVTDFENEVRADMGLPPAPPVKVEEVRRIMKETSLAQSVGVTQEGGKQ